MAKEPMMSGDIKEAADKIGNNWITASDFEGTGLVLQIAQPIQKVKSFNPKYGAQDADFLVKKELLEVGETFRYVFNTKDGETKTFDSKSSPFFIGIKQVEDLGVGDWIHIGRTGKGGETRYSVEKVEPQKVSQANKSYDADAVDEMIANQDF